MEHNDTVESIVSARFGVRELPEDIKERIAFLPFETNGVGMSDSCVFMLPDSVLKVQKRSVETDNEAAILKWLRGRVPAPECLSYAVTDGIAFTLMGRMKGKMLCDPDMMKTPERVIALMAEGLRLLQSVDLSDCPVISSRLTERLKQARYNVEQGLVDMEDGEPGTWEEFGDPASLITWLENNRPDEELTLTHGDYCLPNLFTDGERVTSFIDLGKAGPADKWQDIAIGIRSLKSNFEGRYSSQRVYDGFTPQMLTDRLGIGLDAEKMRYYILLDELF